MSNHAGLQFVDPGFSPVGKLLLRFLFALPVSVREGLLFSSPGRCLPLQKALRRSLGGAFAVSAEFTEGLLRGHRVECLSSEKYFMLGVGFEREVQGILREMIRPGDIVYDVGAHIGYTTLLFSVLCGPTGHVFSFEPSPISYQRLKRNIDLNGEKNVTLVNLAASDAEGTALITTDGSCSRIVDDAGESGKGFLGISTVCLDDFVYRDLHPAPTFAKIDVEGHAGRCLDGMRRILQEEKPSLLIELHHPEEAMHVARVLDGLYAIRDIDSPTGFPRRIIATRNDE